MSEDTNDIPRPVKLLGVFWPVALAALSIGAIGVRADAQIDAVDARVTTIETEGAPVTRERLARIEQQQLANSRQLDRMEQKLDELDARSRNRNLDGL